MGQVVSNQYKVGQASHINAEQAAKWSADDSLNSLEEGGYASPYTTGYDFDNGRFSKQFRNSDEILFPISQEQEQIRAELALLQVDLTSPAFWDHECGDQTYNRTAEKLKYNFNDVVFDTSKPTFTTEGHSWSRTFETIKEQCRQPRFSSEMLKFESGVGSAFDDESNYRESILQNLEDQRRDSAINYDDPQYIQEKLQRTEENKSFIESKFEQYSRPQFNIEDWPIENETDHDFRKLIAICNYMCYQIEGDNIEYDIYVESLKEWSRNLKYLGKNFKVGVTDFISRANYLTNNRELLVKNGIITEQDDEYRYLTKFMDLEIELGIHSSNVLNNKDQMKKAVEKCKNMQGPHKITKEIAQDLIKNQYCGTCRTVLRGAWFYELIENIYYNFCTYRQEPMSTIGRRCYDKFLAPKHNWLYKKICNLALKLLIDRSKYTRAAVEEQQKMQRCDFTEDMLIDQMWQLQPCQQQLSEYLWNYYRERDMIDLP